MRIPLDTACRRRRQIPRAERKARGARAALFAALLSVALTGAALCQGDAAADAPAGAEEVPRPDFSLPAAQDTTILNQVVLSFREHFRYDQHPDSTLYGTVELHAYKVLGDGTIVRDTRLVVVDAPNDLTVGVVTDKEVYRPGETAQIDLQTSDHAGSGVQTALGLAIVDESVFALQQQDPGFAKLYFMLEQELMEPFYQIKQFEFPAEIQEDEDVLRQTQDDAAKAAWSGIPATATVSLNSREIKMASIEQAQASGFQRLEQFGTLATVFVPLLLWIVVVVILVDAHAFEKAVERTFVGAAILVGVAIPLFCVVLATQRQMAGEFAAMFYPFLIIFVGGGLFLAGYGWQKRNTAAQFVGLLALAWSGAVWVLDRALGQSASPSMGLIALAVLGGLMIPGVYLLFGQGLWVQEQHAAGATATGMSALAVLLLVLLPFLLASCGAAMGRMMPAQVTAPPQVVKEEEAAPAQEGAPRLRQYFPETLYWAPEVVTDRHGYVALDIPLADSITTWRLTALASSQDGRLGFTTHGVRVFQDFFVDIDLPVALTVDDEVSIPVGVYNYLPEEQQVRLEVQQEPWFELLGAGEQVIAIAPNDITVVYFPIRVRDFGQQGFQVTAWGTQMNDAIRREVQVVPNGKEVWQTESNWLRTSREVPIDIPAGAVDGATYVEVKIYPGALAQVVEGLENILHLPHG
ncbi:MAG: alpha-2-macroglobulin family protein [Candidatus Eisenbacteria bacterium]